MKIGESYSLWHDQGKFYLNIVKSEQGFFITVPDKDLEDLSVGHVRRSETESTVQVFQEEDAPDSEPYF